MLTHAITAYSETSASAAISAAIGEASADYSKDAKFVHIIVSSVFKIGETWKAIVKIIIEPNLEKKLEENIEILEQHYEQKKQKDLENEGSFFELEAGEPVQYIYFPSSYEHIYEDFMLEGPNIHVHLIEEGPLWDNLHDYFLDAEFYEASHTSELAKRHEADSRQFQENMKKPELIRKQKQLLEDLELDG